MKYCARCLYPANHPLKITFDKKNVCSGCYIHEEKDVLNWNSRKEKLARIFNAYRSKNSKNYDCIIPVSGARDSYFVVHTVKKEFGMHPLLVTYNKQYNTYRGIRNLAYLRTKLGCDIATFTVSPERVKKVTRATIKEFGSIYWHCIAGQTAYPVQNAVRLKIPLIIWGAHQGIDQVGMFSHTDEVEMTRKYRKEHDLMGYEAEDLLGIDNLTKKELGVFFYPNDKEIEKVGVRGIYLNNYIRWDTKKQHEKMIELYGYESALQHRTFDTYNDVDCFHYSDLHDYLKLIKYGYGKVTDHATREIRLGRLTREEGIKLVRQYQNIEPNLQKTKLFLDWLGMTEKEFWGFANKFRNSEIWEQHKKEWQLKDSVISHANDKGVEEVRISKKEKKCEFIISPARIKNYQEKQYILVGRGWIDEEKKHQESKKTIFFVIASENRVNFILRTDIFKILKEKGYRLVIISPYKNNPQFRDEFKGSNIIFEELCKAGKVADMINNLRNEKLKINHPKIKEWRIIHGQIKRRYKSQEHAIISFLKEGVKKIILGITPQKKIFWDFIEKWLVVNRCCRKLFKKYKPDVVIMASAGAGRKDASFILYAKKNKILSYAVDNNIDVFEWRYLSTPRDVSGWMLFGENQKKEAMELQRINPKKLITTGPVRYDHYLRNFKPLPRREFFQDLGLDPNKKLITYGAKIPIIYPQNADIIKSLKNISEKENNNAQLFVRFDPKHDPLQYGTLLDNIPWERGEEKSHRDHVANLLYHSDVIVSIGSTFCIEACLVNTPAIWIGFDGYKKHKNPLKSYRAVYDLDLFQRIIKTGAIPLVETLEELIKEIENYLASPEKDTAERKKMIHQEYGVADGYAGERIANYIIDQLEKETLKK
ncbi:MAG: hypothetical protein COU08_01770 [Candidatus Harrisonbacteria bacterium CG10_big_fil_rev_8_21_14_0_10_42_17]|uniref:LPS biosynthesis protein n=1 Tax=Candidatus Harrisonbacteria bacterium CG10_big_fil_rev_8_21_14_0_10_42_17 TaxID=1974584 RepID=A0A2M6WIH7_9BACT|nr:MAG: hypothetical protein COU08_01770 [Candidatus Harrisonbacteria bacterium CG10_big_fil_rev_8_21_14_0_10_42_17]